MTSGLDRARRVADAVLYEGYLLFPYRASAAKNRFRWQFGVVVPEAQARVDPGEAAAVRCETLLEAQAAAEVEATVRFLHVRRHGGDDTAARDQTVLDEGVERQLTTGPLAVSGLVAAEHTAVLRLTGDDAAGDAALAARLRVAAEVRHRDRGLVLLRACVTNDTDWCDPAAPRDEVLRHSMVGVHLLLAVRGGAFVSLLDPPAWAAGDAAACVNEHTYPVLAGEPGARDVVLSAPIILHDHPEVAPESPGDWHDATEIDELLTLSVRSLTDEEKREARATDPRAAAIVDRADALPPEMLERLHGAVRSLRPVARETAAAARFGEEAPGLQRLRVDGGEIRVGSRVRLAPSRRADAQDIFVDGRVARVERIVDDLDGEVHVAVTLEDDPGADLHAWYGRFLYFHPDEVELLADPGVNSERT